jgi:hypothetical protein
MRCALIATEGTGFLDGLIGQSNRRSRRPPLGAEVQPAVMVRFLRSKSVLR